MSMDPHYVLQWDEAAHVVVVHDRMLLGTGAEHLVTQQKATIEYKQGVATERKRSNWQPG